MGECARCHKEMVNGTVVHVVDDGIICGVCWQGDRTEAAKCQHDWRPWGKMEWPRQKMLWCQRRCFKCRRTDADQFVSGHATLKDVSDWQYGRVRPEWREVGSCNCTRDEGDDNARPAPQSS